MELVPPGINAFYSYLFGPLAVSLCIIGAIFLASLNHARSMPTMRSIPAGGAAPTALRWLSINTFLLPLAFFFESTPPSVGPVDAGSMSLAAWLPGVAHPPGFPLNMALGHAALLATRGWLPLGTAHVLNLLSSLGGALTVHLVWRQVPYSCTNIYMYENPKYYPWMMHAWILHG